MGLTLRDVTKIVENETHLSDINLTLNPGERYVLLGRTLAGKTSLLRIMAGLDRPTKGSVLENDVDVTGVTVRKRDVAMVYQQFINYPSLSIYNNIASPLKIHGVPKAEIDQRVRKAAEMLHIEHLLDRLPAELSGGQQQRCAIARALVKDVHLLLLDEPLVNLDYKLREELREELQQIFTERESVVVYTTTEPTEALMLGGNVVVMHEGKILQVGPTAEVYRNPANLEVAKVFSDPPMNFLPGVVADGALRLGQDITMEFTDATKELAPGEYLFGVRANRLNLGCSSDRQACITGKIELGEINGSETFIHFMHGDSQLVIQEEGVHSFETGAELSVYVDPAHFYVFDKQGDLLISPNQK